MIDRQVALRALEEIEYALWEIDIPSPTIAEYMEHHEQVQKVMLLVDKWGRELRDMPSADQRAQRVESDRMRWIPVKTRPMTEEEIEYYAEHYGYDIEGDWAVMFDCPMPEDGQEVWVCFKSGYVAEDVCDNDDGMIGLEGNGDWDDVVAWMPRIRPEPYKEEACESR